MLFQTFDEKKECFLIFRNGKFCEELTEDCEKTWTYAPYLQDHPRIEYANLYVQKNSLEEACPSFLRERYNTIALKLKAFLKAASTTGLSLDRFCLYDMIPEHVLVELANLKNEVCIHIFNNHPKPQHYDHMLKIAQVVGDIKYRELNLDLNKILRLTVQDKNTYKLLKENKNYIDYDQFKTITGRLSTRKHSFPIMTLAKKYREVVKPTNDWLFELDFNAAELRTALGLLGYPQPSIDLHQWNIKHLFNGTKDRENAKRSAFAALYNPHSPESPVTALYDRKKLKSLYFKDNKVMNPFHRVIECDEDHAISYLIQSTAADVLFEQMYAVWEFLKNKKSFLKFCNHDSIVIDLAEEDQYLVNDMKEVFCKTRFGRFKINCEGGRDWLNMKKLNIN